MALPEKVYVETGPASKVGVYTSVETDRLLLLATGTPDTAAQILTKIKTVDGAGSGLDADSLDGLASTAFVPKSAYTAANDILVGTGASAVLKKNPAEIRAILNVADGATASVGDVSSAANITDHSVVRGNGGAKGVQGSGVLVDDSNNLTGIAAATLSGLLTLSAGQIKFPATQNDSSDANTLDDYEEGTWTPTDASGGGLTLIAANARYVKIGNTVYLSMLMTFPTNTDTTHYVTFGGLPFTSLFIVSLSTATSAGVVINSVVQGTTLSPKDINLTTPLNSVLSNRFITVSGFYPV